MATGGRKVALLLFAIAACGTGSQVFAAEQTVRHVSYGQAGHVVMPHPNACACCNEEKGFCEGLWEKLRPGHRDRYVTRQHTRHLNHPECPPWCMESYGYYQTCWRRFPEHTLGCRPCWDTGSPPPPASPVPAMPYTPQAAPPAPPSLPPVELKPVPPMEYETLPIPNPVPEIEPEVEDPSPITQTGAVNWNDPAWKAGLRRGN